MYMARGVAAAISNKEKTMCKCKCAKYWPHNWFCLKGLYWIFVVLFYISIIAAVYFTVQLCRIPAEMYAAAGQSKLLVVMNYLIPTLLGALGFITVGTILKTLRKIKKAVAPCCCQQEEETEVTVEEVVEHESK